MTKIDMDHEKTKDKKPPKEEAPSWSTPKANQ